jgi:hypothetical protein
MLLDAFDPHGSQSFSFGGRNASAAALTSPSETNLIVMTTSL